MALGGARSGGEVAVVRLRTHAGRIAFVSLLGLGVCAATATAEPLSMTINQARANMGAQLSDFPLVEAPNTVSFEAQIDPVSGEITEGVLEVPEFSTSGLTVDLEFKDITGSFSQATRTLTMEGEANGRLAASGSECAVSTTPPVVILSSAGSSGGASPRFGAPFTAGLAGEGAVAGQWTDMSATPIGPGDALVCAIVEGNIEGPGGVWLAQGSNAPQPAAPTSSSTNAPPPAPPPPTCVVPKLAGKTLARAKVALKTAGCRLGKVNKPKQSRGKGHRALIVKSSAPATGSRPADGEVNLRLGPKPLKARR